MNIHNHGILRRFLVVLFAIVIFTVAITENVSVAATRTPRLNVKTLSLVKGKSYKLRLYNTSSDHTITFKSDDTSIATVTCEKKNICRIKAKASGQTTITAYITNNITDEITELSCDVTVTPPAVTVKFCKKKIKLQVGATKKAKISLKPATSLEILRFSSDDPTIASVSSNGIVTANKVGKTIIRVRIGNGKAAKCRIDVKEKKDTKDKNNKDTNNNTNNNTTENNNDTDNNTNNDTDNKENNKDTAVPTPYPKATATPAPNIITPNMPHYYPNHNYNYDFNKKDIPIDPDNEYYYYYR